jgi:hypothetical protein
MAERRNLIEGLKATPTIDPAVAKEFIHGPRDTSGSREVENAPDSKIAPLRVVNHARTAIHTRMRDDFAKALKRASLERQLAGVEPSTLQDILEEAVEPWLRSNGYLS